MAELFYKNRRFLTFIHLTCMFFMEMNDCCSNCQDVVCDASLRKYCSPWGHTAWNLLVKYVFLLSEAFTAQGICGFVSRHTHPPSITSWCGLSLHISYWFGHWSLKKHSMSAIKQIRNTCFIEKKLPSAGTLSFEFLYLFHNCCLITVKPMHDPAFNFV